MYRKESNDCSGAILRDFIMRSSLALCVSGRNSPRARARGSLRSRLTCGTLRASLWPFFREFRARADLDDSCALVYKDRAI